MGFKDLFSTLKSLSTPKQQQKPKMKLKKPLANIEQQQQQQQRIVYDQYGHNDEVVMPRRTKHLLETHSKHVNRIIMDNEIKTSPSFDMSSIYHHRSSTSSHYDDQCDQDANNNNNNNNNNNTKRCKIRTNPWIRSPTFHSTIHFPATGHQPPNQSDQQQQHNTSTSSSSGVSSISQCCGIESASSSSDAASRTRQFILDDYSFKCEQTLELVELNSIFDNILLNNDEFPVSSLSSSSSMCMYATDKNNNNNSNLDDDEDEIELDRCVYELYKQIDMLREQKMLLDQKVHISKQIRI